jgi:hypothetical protein
LFAHRYLSQFRTPISPALRPIPSPVIGDLALQPTYNELLAIKSGPFEEEDPLLAGEDGLRMRCMSGVQFFGEPGAKLL